ncbi:MAG: hypothetical protein ACYTFZ_09620, partial [Planctomycetota bacterium]
PTSARGLELYSSKKGAGAAAKEIVAQLKRDITRLQREAKTLSVVDGIPALAKLIGTIYDEGVYKVMCKHSAFGATDTEPRYHIAQALVDTAKALLGRSDDYMPELADWI